MAVEVLMPKFGLTMHDGTIQRFFKSRGESVRQGEPLYEVETEKVLYEVESPATGVVAVILFEPESSVECGQAVAVIAEPGEDADQIAARYRRPPTAGQQSTQAGAAPPSVDRAAGAEAAGGARKLVSPIARKLATELGVDLERVIGTGPGGRITREDVQQAAAATSVPTRSATAASQLAGQVAVSSLIPLRGMRRTIAERMHSSLQQSAQLTITSEADVTAARERRARLRTDFHVTYTDMMVEAVARALRRSPRLNSRVAERGIEILTEVNVGVAVAVEEGLIVPVIRNADRKSLAEIAELSRSFAERARSSALKLEDVTGGTFTISNLGTYGVDAFTPIINPGEAAILGMGRMIEKPAFWRGRIAPRWMMTLSLTFDHRIVDGAPAAEFLREVIELFNQEAE